ncbi:MAG: isopeptide-forming domain-containing fimbrial protein, partial [Ilumatobacteraceae bacterium]
MAGATTLAPTLIDENVTASSGRLEWALGESGAGDDRYVAPGSRFQVLVWAEITAAPAGIVADKPQNLMKYRQENVLGQVYFLREAAAFEREAQRVTLTKGVQSIDGLTPTNGLPVGDPGRVTGADFDSDIDDIEVASGNAVTFRIDLTGPQSGVDGLVVWDALPSGVTCAAISAAAGASCVDAQSTSLGARSVITWAGLSLPTATAPAGNGFRTLTYTMTVPAGTSVEADLVNTASVISYESGANAGDNLIYRPAGSLDEDATANIPGDGTVDVSNVYLPAASVAKSVTSSVATNNANGQLVRGEIGTYTYSVTVPAGTTVHNGQLVDALPGQLTRTATPATATRDGGALPTGVTLDPVTGTLSFGTAYSNATAADQVFTVVVEAYLNGTATHNQTVTNTVTFTSNRSATSTETYSHATTRSVTALLIAPTVAKWVSAVGSTTYAADTSAETDTRPATAGATVTYTVRVTNPGTRPTAYDSVVTDCAPEQLAVDLATATTTVGTVENPATSAPIASDAACATGTRIVWQVGTLAPGATATLTYRAVVATDAGGFATYTNVADLTAYSLPATTASGYRQEADADNQAIVRVGGATITKTAQNLTTGTSCTTGATECRAAIGDSMRYTVTVLIPRNISFYDAVFTDSVPAGMSLTSATVTANPSGLAIDGPRRYTTSTTFAPSTPVETTSAGTAARTFVWTVSDSAATNDLLAVPTDRTFTVTYDGVLTATSATAPAANVVVSNVAFLRWHSVDGTGTYQSVSATRNTRVLAPNPAITKTVDGLDALSVAPGGDDFEYVVTITNPNVPATGSTAFDLDVVDTVPYGVQLTGTPTITATGATLPATPVVVDGSGSTVVIRTSIDALTVGGSVVIRYPANLIASSQVVPGAALTNVAAITEYYSNDPETTVPRRFAPTTLQADAVVTPLFPVIGVTKTTTDPIAYIGVAKPFTIVTGNTGLSAAVGVTLDDTLPTGWEYVAGTARIAGVAVEPTVSGSDLRWVLGDVPAGGSRTLTYDARPVSPGAWGVGNTGHSTASFTNTVVATAVDGSGASGNAGPTLASTADDVTYSASSSATAFIDRADLAITKTHTGSTVAGSATGVTYAIGVGNLGPDTAVGPIVVTDTLPAGVVFRSATAAGWTVSGPTAGVLTFTRNAPLTIGQSAGAISVTVDIPSDTAAGTVVTNTATVAGRTFETATANNTATDPLTVTAEADVTVDKTITATTFVAGEDAVWTLAVTNHGPSTTRGSAAAPIVVTDTLPAGTGTATWSAPAGSGWDCVVAATTVTCAYPHDLLLGATSPLVTITTPVDSGTTGTLTNSATVVPVTSQGANTRGDSDSAAVAAVGAAADLSIVKSVVPGETFPAGGTGRYRIEVVNDGPSDAVSVTVQDALPAGLHYAGRLTADPDLPWSCAENATDATLVDCVPAAPGVLVADGETWFEFDVTIDSSVFGVIRNVAAVSSPTDTVPTNNTDDAEITAELVTDLAIDKATTATVLDGGDVFTYTIDVANVEAADAANVTVTDVLPAQLRLLGVTAGSTGVAWDACDPAVLPSAYGATVTCELSSDLPAGASAATLTLEVEVAPDRKS